AAAPAMAAGAAVKGGASQGSAARAGRAASRTTRARRIRALTLALSSARWESTLSPHRGLFVGGGEFLYSGPCLRAGIVPAWGYPLMVRRLKLFWKLALIAVLTPVSVLLVVLVALR